MLCIVTNLDGYAFVRSDSATHSGFAGMCIKKSLTYKKKLDCHLRFIEKTWIELETNFGPKQVESFIVLPFISKMTLVSLKITCKMFVRNLIVKVTLVIYSETLI